jgi:hypothetical protein
MQISIPEDLGGELRKLEGVAQATSQSFSFGTSKSGNPKLTLKYVITDEMDGIGEDEPSAVGETVLETFSLQPQALWKLNELYKQCTGEKLPQGDYSKEEFEELLNENIIGVDFNLVLELKIPDDGSSTEERTEVTDRTVIS